MLDLAVGKFYFCSYPDRPSTIESNLICTIKALNDTRTSRRVLKPSNLMSALAASNNNNRRLMCYDQQVRVISVFFCFLLAISLS
jgi:hypothetical protein